MTVKPNRKIEGQFIQLATRVPEELLRALKTHCVEAGRPIYAVVREALEEALAAKSRRRRKHDAEPPAAA